MELTKMERELINKHCYLHLIGIAMSEGIAINSEEFEDMATKHINDIIEPCLLFKKFGYHDKEINRDDFMEYSGLILIDEFGMEKYDEILKIAITSLGGQYE